MQSEAICKNFPTVYFSREGMSLKKQDVHILLIRHGRDIQNMLSYFDLHSASQLNWHWMTNSFFLSLEDDWVRNDQSLMWHVLCLLCCFIFE